MKRVLIFILIGFLIFVLGWWTRGMYGSTHTQETKPQTIDTLVDVGTHKLHFKIIKGKGMPILFETGAGDNETVWDSILNPIAEITGTTLITYDRTGLGKSTVDTLETDVSKHGILNDLEDLESALRKLGYDKQIMLVSHSYGGYLTTLYTDRHPELVKSIVLIDVSHNFHQKYLENEKKELEQHIQEAKKQSLGVYYMTANFIETLKLMSNLSIPQNIPVVDFIDGISFFDDKEMIEHWKECHKQFVANHPKSIGITAFGCGHYIWRDNPSLIITTIVKSYAETMDEKQKTDIYNRALNYVILFSSKAVTSNHSEFSLNSWGYNLLASGENIQALDVFKLIVTLYPLSWNAYDSYGEALLKNNQKEEAIKMYKKSVELNPKNENGKKVLEELLKQ